MARHFLHNPSIPTEENTTPNLRNHTLRLVPNIESKTAIHENECFDPKFLRPKHYRGHDVNPPAFIIILYYICVIRAKFFDKLL